MPRPKSRAFVLAALSWLRAPLIWTRLAFWTALQNTTLPIADYAAKRVEALAKLRREGL